MYIYEEVFDGRKLSDIINTEHENLKYLPDIKLPNNIIAIPDVVRVTKDADILIFVLPHQFVIDTCTKMKEVTKSTALAVSLIKGFILEDDNTGMQLVSQVITDILDIDCAVLMGANLATEVASEMFCETTIGVEDPDHDEILRYLFETNFFRCKIIRDVQAVEACGALKNVVAIGAGVIDGLGFGDNTKAAIIRLGLMEMIKFSKQFFEDMGLPKIKNNSAFLESCGIADLVATCHGGRNRLLGEAIVKSMKKRGATGGDIKVLEKEILRGQCFQGPMIAAKIYLHLEKTEKLEQYPLLVTIHKICCRETDPRNFIDALRNHPEHM